MVAISRFAYTAPAEAETIPRDDLASNSIICMWPLSEARFLALICLQHAKYCLVLCQLYCIQNSACTVGPRFAGLLLFYIIWRSLMRNKYFIFYTQ